MKKRIVALALCSLVMTSILCINVFAMADKTKEISLDNIYDIVYSENPNITMTGNSIYNSNYSAQLASVSYNTGVSTLNSIQSQKKIAYSAEQTLFSYYTTLNSISKIEDQVKAMERTVAVAKIKLDLGMISQLEYNTTLITQKDLQATLISTNESFEKLKGNLNLLINNNYDDEINIVDFSAMDVTLIDALNKDNCYTDAQNNSIDLDASKLSLDGAISKDETSGSNQTTKNSRENAYISYVQSQRNFDLNFESQWNGLLQKKDTLMIKEMNFATAEKNYELGKIKYELGMISKNEYVALDETYNSDKIAFQTAQIDLYSAYKKFMAFVKGVSM